MISFLRVHVLINVQCWPSTVNPQEASGREQSTTTDSTAASDGEPNHGNDFVFQRTTDHAWRTRIEAPLQAGQMVRRLQARNDKREVLLVSLPVTCFLTYTVNNGSNDDMETG
ncbi:hypothetical protein Tco_0213804 [Tanacetum coccineum]